MIRGGRLRPRPFLFTQETTVDEWPYNLSNFGCALTIIGSIAILIFFTFLAEYADRKSEQNDLKCITICESQKLAYYDRNTKCICTADGELRTFILP